jgi:cytochrome b involved in lipid metabolism
VYNVTEYARDHPGGPDTLMEVAGTDATSAYEDVSIRRIAIRCPVLIASV